MSQKVEWYRPHSIVRAMMYRVLFFLLSALISAIVIKLCFAIFKLSYLNDILFGTNYIYYPYLMFIAYLSCKIRPYRVIAIVDKQYLWVKEGLLFETNKMIEIKDIYSIYDDVLYFKTWHNYSRLPIKVIKYTIPTRHKFANKKFKHLVLHCNNEDNDYVNLSHNLSVHIKNIKDKVDDYNPANEIFVDYTHKRTDNPIVIFGNSFGYSFSWFFVWVTLLFLPTYALFSVIFEWLSFSWFFLILVILTAIWHFKNRLVIYPDFMIVKQWRFIEWGIKTYELVIEFDEFCFLDNSWANKSAVVDREMKKMEKSFYDSLYGGQYLRNTTVDIFKSYDMSDRTFAIKYMGFDKKNFKAFGMNKKSDKYGLGNHFVLFFYDNHQRFDFIIHRRKEIQADYILALIKAHTVINQS